MSELEKLKKENEILRERLNNICEYAYQERQIWWAANVLGFAYDVKPEDAAPMYRDKKDYVKS